MKRLKNVMLYLACGLVTASVTTSCKKEEGTPAPVTPTITAVSPNTALAGATVTITGTNLTGATVTFYNGVAAVPTSITATSITVTVPATAATGNITVTTSNGTTTIPFTVSAPIPTSDDIATANLIAHWTFDTDSKETFSQNAALTGGAYNVGTVSYGAGRIGNAATFVNGALVYGTIPNLNLDTALQSYTVSMWIKMKGRWKDNTNDNTRWSSLWQLNSNAYTDVFGIVGVQALNQKSLDTLAFQIDQVQIDGTGPHLGGFGCGGCFGGVTNPLNLKVDTTKWSLLTVTYDGNGLNQKLKVYLDGAVKDSLTLTTVSKPSLATAETFRVLPGGGPTPPIPAAWANYVTIGTFNWKDFPIFSNSNGYNSVSPLAADRAGYMANGINGSLDDIRVFNTAISPAEVLELYTRGNAGH